MNKFTIEFTIGAMQFGIQGAVSAEILQKETRSLNAEVVRNYFLSSSSITGWLADRTLSTLMRIRAELMGYIASAFPAFQVEQLEIIWRNGEDALHLQ